ncbi:MAG: cytochrome C [Geobacteraceae bacterium GWB2_52_12]|nr:MAG: cytochrome C [Geobacteraceae bacterium GWB2_52_12]
MHIAIVPVLIAMLLVSACTALKEGHPLLPVSEYEKMVVGRLDADYVGTDNCVAKCHTHDKITNDFKLSVHGEQITPETGLPLVNCETCHGPGSLAIDKIERNKQLLGEKGDKCDVTKLLDYKALPPQAQSLICLKCHSAASTPTLAQWHTSVHALNDLSCFTCHKLHEGPHQKVSRDQMAELCYGCHPEVKAQFSLFSHHPVREKKMGCFDCHDPHGSSIQSLLKGSSQRDMCTRCHMEKNGPFAYEHGDVTENCTNCHTSHGSANRRLLTAAMPFLCIQCHSPSHRSTLVDQSKPLFANRCTDCHSTIHGSDTPSNSGLGTLRK